MSSDMQSLVLTYIYDLASHQRASAALSVYGFCVKTTCTPLLSSAPPASDNLPSSARQEHGFEPGFAVFFENLLTGMLPTPETPDLPGTVYPPSEDSYLLLDTLSSPSETAFLSARFSFSGSPSRQLTPLVLEVGTGSGIVLAFLTAHAQHIFGRSDIAALAVDVNPDACKTAGRTAALACSSCHTSALYQGSVATSTGVYLDAVQSDLTAALRSQSVDVLIFNPPYVPTDEVPSRPLSRPPSPIAPVPTTAAMTTTTTKSDLLSAFELESRYLDIAVAGGKDGMQVTERLLAQLDSLLRPDTGVAYVLFSVRNTPSRVTQQLRQQGWTVDQVGTTGRKGGIEKLVILRIMR